MKKFVCLLVFLSLSGTSMAEMYKWVDENGKVHYTDQDPALNNQAPANVEVITPEAGNTYSADEAMSPEMKETLDKMTEDRKTMEDKRRAEDEAAKEAAQSKEYEANAKKIEEENAARERRKKREIRERRERAKGY